MEKASPAVAEHHHFDGLPYSFCFLKCEAHMKMKTPKTTYEEGLFME